MPKRVWITRCNDLQACKRFFRLMHEVSLDRRVAAELADSIFERDTLVQAVTEEMKEFGDKPEPACHCSGAETGCEHSDFCPSYTEE